MAVERIGWIGTGVMGKSMCLHLLEKGFPLSVNNRTRESAADLCRLGAAWCETPGEVARSSDIVFSMVGEPADVEEVIMGPDGILDKMAPGKVTVDMTTSEPSLAGRIHAAARARAVSSLDAPVSGGDIGAREGTLSIMVGGDEATFNRVLPLFMLMGKNIALMGGPGMGQHTKMSNQILIASTMIGVVESLLYARRAGLDMNRVVSLVGQGAAASWAYSHLGPKMLKGDFAPGFLIRHIVKDMGIALAEARRMKLSLPGLALANQVYVAAMAEGLESEGTQGLYKVLDRMNHP